jgi:hypothetical protein
LIIGSNTDFGFEFWLWGLTFDLGFVFWWRSLVSAFGVGIWVSYLGFAFWFVDLTLVLIADPESGFGTLIPDFGLWFLIPTVAFEFGLRFSNSEYGFGFCLGFLFLA